MPESNFKTEIADLALSANLLDGSFRLQQRPIPPNALLQVRALHQHSTYEVFFVTNSLTVVTEQEERKFHNAVVIISPQFKHYVIYEEQGGYDLFFSIAPLPKKQQEFHDRLQERLQTGITALPMAEDELFYVSRLAESIEGTLPREQAEHLVPLLFSALFHRLVPKAAAPADQSKYGRYINTLDHYISAHFFENIKLSDLAEQLYLCPRQVSRILQKEYGMSLSRLVHQKRLSTACMLLKHTDLPISEIAGEMGYEYESYFFTRFRAEYGITPTEYREQNKQ